VTLTNCRTIAHGDLGCVQVRWHWQQVALSAPCLLPLAVLLHVWSAAV
jgi:hypothetical protein